ncbi:MAG: ABC transporter ATP-binding protein [Gemmatimonadetes bacterium]|nr:ABC transporter ATP-binding protein [Gemmatimonadota bacterium]MYE17067.1 ABC transporter ATP-binding protein [Gemmatimonadota bacterium]
MLTLEQLSIGYRSRRDETVLASDISLELREGELVCLLGPNGAGKSTLMRTVAGMQPPLAGRVLVDGDDIHSMPARDRARRLSVVLTERVHAGLLTAYALVGLGRYPHINWSGRLTDRDHEVIRECLERVGAQDLAHRYVSDLSDGERQRVMMARALAQEPRLMVLDEITAFLDLPRRVDAMRLLRRVVRETSRAVLLSTHDLELALRAADRVWLLPTGGPLATGAPEDLVLSGAFEAAFASEGVDFDRARGEFQVHRHFVGEVELVGDGLARYWTARALEREGVHVWEGDGPAPPILVVVPDGEGGEWIVSGGGAQVRHPCLYDLALELRARFQTVEL